MHTAQRWHPGTAVLGRRLERRGGSLAEFPAAPAAPRAGPQLHRSWWYTRTARPFAQPAVDHAPSPSTQGNVSLVAYMRANNMSGTRYLEAQTRGSPRGKNGDGGGGAGRGSAPSVAWTRHKDLRVAARKTRQRAARGRDALKHCGRVAQLVGQRRRRVL